ncbi:MAG: hypothetical protein LBI58_02055 [Tannerellaceae bacterium]|nr:hypothetical protein [Tannerellaceae bacterium]
MKHAAYTLLILSSFLVLTACDGRGKEAAARLENARSLYEANEWMAARNEIDTIRAHYPMETATLREALMLIREIERKEAGRNIVYCDSLIPVRQAEAAEASAGFVFEKDSAYEETGKYINRKQTVERNIERSYIRCGVSEDGRMYLESVYFGAHPIRHTAIRISRADGIFAETASIAIDGALNYSFKDGDKTSEIVHYKGKDGEDAIKFIFSNAGERLKVDYIGGAPYALYMGDADKEAIAATYNLAAILTDIYTLTAERSKAAKRKEYLEGKLEPADLTD